jgi:hypothetical protein
MILAFPRITHNFDPEKNLLELKTRQKYNTI